MLLRGQVRAGEIIAVLLVAVAIIGAIWFGLENINSKPVKDIIAKLGKYLNDSKKWRIIVK